MTQKTRLLSKVDKKDKAGFVARVVVVNGETQDLYVTFLDYGEADKSTTIQIKWKTKRLMIEAHIKNVFFPLFFLYIQKDPL